MPGRIRPVQGAPCWVSLLARDAEAAQAFYGALLGWQYRPDPQERGPYWVALANGVPVAGLGATAQGLGFPVTWTAYFAADSADTAAQRVRERGATVAVGPIGFGEGRVVWASDPAGAVFGIWEGEVDSAWRMGRQPGAPAWLELRTGDAFEAALFYGAVFGWDTGDPGRYDVRFEDDRVILRINGRAVAGLFGGAVEAAPDPQVRPRWHVYFCVEDVDAAARLAIGLGGRVMADPADSPYGRTAALRDPEGGLFSIASRHA